ncbi:hypothetical protein BJ742DRAFT_10039 [Cladochytrium replicatum]|nr:hypothetical protein BJ742DRAFT_10039 [Cladochytrium replicatum]
MLFISCSRSYALLTKENHCRLQSGAKLSAPQCHATADMIHVHCGATNRIRSTTSLLRNAARGVHSESVLNGEKHNLSDEQKNPRVVDGVYRVLDAPDEVVATSEDLHEKPKERFTADINPQVLNKLFGQYLKSQRLAESLKSIHFETTRPANDNGNSSSTESSYALTLWQQHQTAEESTAYASPDTLKRALIFDRQRGRAMATGGAGSGGTGGLVPLANRTHLTGGSGYFASPSKRSARDNLIRAAFAKEDAGMYKKSVDELWSEFASLGELDSGIHSVVEERIAQARRRGEFDDLKGRGKPLDLETEELRNPFLDPTSAYLNRMFTTQGDAPGWVSASREAKLETGKLRRELREIWENVCNPPPPPSPDASTKQTGRWKCLIDRLVSWSTGSSTLTVNSTNYTNEQISPQLSQVRFAFGGYSGELRQEQDTRSIKHTERISSPVEIPMEEPEAMNQKEAEFDARARKWADLRIKEINAMIRRYNLEAPGMTSHLLYLNVDKELKRAKGIPMRVSHQQTPSLEPQLPHSAI